MRKKKGPAPLLMEIEPACEYFGRCGGCTYQGITLKREEEIKTKEIRDLFVPELGDELFDEIFEGIIQSPEVDGYRNKMEFSFGDSMKDGPLELGMHRRGSFYDIVTVDGCRIADEDFSLAIRATLDFFREKGATYFHKMRHTGFLRHLLVRKAKKTGEILIDIVTTSGSEEVADPVVLLAEYAQMLVSQPFSGKLTGVLHTTNDSVADTITDQGTEVLWGNDYFFEELLGLKFKITPFSFFQTNSLGAELLYGKAREYIKSSKADGLGTLFDLYSGTGTIAQIMSPAAAEVIGIEIVEEAVVAARENAELNGLTNCRFIAGDVLKELTNVEEKPDYIILDPPRDGVHPKALKMILDYGVDNILYIACKASSLSRDLPVMRAAGYEPKRMCCVEMFPRTKNIETVCLLSRKAPA